MWPFDHAAPGPCYCGHESASTGLGSGLWSGAFSKSGTSCRPCNGEKARGCVVAWCTAAFVARDAVHAMDSHMELRMMVVEETYRGVRFRNTDGRP